MTTAGSHSRHRARSSGWTFPTWLTAALGGASILWLLAASPAQYQPSKRDRSAAPSADVSSPLGQELLKREVEKVHAEIAGSLDSAADAFLQKFVLIGAILVALSGLKKEDARQVFDRLSSRPGLSVALSVAAIVSLLIDAKMRANVVTIDLKAQWLLSIEERFSDQILLYEHYLRRPGNLHTDEVFRYVHWMQLSAATGILYVGYLASLSAPSDDKTQRHQVHALVFYTCQVALLIFAFAAHYLPADLHVLRYWPVTDSVIHSSPLVNVFVRWVPAALVSSLVWWRSPLRCSIVEGPAYQHRNAAHGGSVA